MQNSFAREHAAEFRKEKKNPPTASFFFSHSSFVEKRKRALGGVPCNPRASSGIVQQLSSSPKEAKTFFWGGEGAELGGCFCCFGKQQPKHRWHMKVFQELDAAPRAPPRPKSKADTRLGNADPRSNSPLRRRHRARSDRGDESIALLRFVVNESLFFHHPPPPHTPTHHCTRLFYLTLVRSRLSFHAGRFYLTFDPPSPPHGPRSPQDLFFVPPPPTMQEGVQKVRECEHASVHGRQV